MGTVKKGIVYAWRHRPHPQWHQGARVIAFLVLMDQAFGPITHIPADVGIVIVALGVLFAPVPTERPKSKP